MSKNIFVSLPFFGSKIDQRYLFFFQHLRHYLGPKTQQINFELQFCANKVTRSVCARLRVSFDGIS